MALWQVVEAFDAARVEFWALAAANVAQLVVLAWFVRRVREMAQIQGRVARLTDAMTLLTDTTEAGLTTLIREMELSRRQNVARTAPRASVARRVMAAHDTGQDLASIACDEALSEGEIHLHLAMARQRQEGSLHA
jgi:hypothetical protein